MVCFDALTCALHQVSENEFPSDHCLLMLKNNGGLVIPNDDVVKVVRIAESVLRSITLLSDLNVSSNKLGTLLEMKVLQRIPRNLFVAYEQHFLESCHGCDSHYFTLIRFICSSFLNIRRHHIARLMNLRRHKTLVRQFNNKLTLFKNQ
jgi:hypothetical protein